MKDKLFPTPALLAVIVIIGLIALTPAINRANTYAANGTAPFSEAYYSSGIFSVHPLKILGVSRLSGTSLQGNFLDLAGEPSGKAIVKMTWQPLQNEEVYYETDYAKINWEVDERYGTPMIKFNFTTMTLREPVRLDVPALGYSELTDLSETVTVFLNKEDYDKVIDLLR